MVNRRAVAGDRDGALGCCLKYLCSACNCRHVVTLDESKVVVKGDEIVITRTSVVCVRVEYFAAPSDAEVDLIGLYCLISLKLNLV
jgi:hypothetical protein